jgi:hypothetical protein
MRSCAPAIAIAVALVLGPAAAGSDRVQIDPQFDFKTIRTWGWDPSGAGDVKMARASDDDPEIVKRRIEPVVMAAVAHELEQRGLAPASGPPDLRMHYYVLITAGTSTQQMGQFLPSITEWGVPPFTPQVTSYDVVQTGSLVLDGFSPASDRVVWRAISQTEIDKIKNDADRDARIRKAARDLIKKLPVKPASKHD